MNHIYVLTIFYKLNTRNSRSVGWYKSFYEARDSLFTNDLDLIEGYAEYAVIEKIASGPYAAGILEYVESWFKIESIGHDFTITPIDKPAEVDGIIGWSLG